MITREAVRELTRSQREPEWMQQLRLSYWERFHALPAPTAFDEDWRRVDVKEFDLSAVEVKPPAKLSARPGLEEELKRKGVFFGTLLEAAEKLPEVVREFLVPSGEWTSDGKFEELVRAAWTNSVFLYVPRGVEVVLPIRGLFGGGQAGSGIFPRTLVVVGEGASATYIDDYASEGAEHPGFSSGLVELYIKEDARLTYLNLQRWGRETVHALTQRAYLGRNASFLGLTVALGGRTTKSYVESLLRGPGSRSEMFGIILGDGRQEFDHQTLQDHAAPQTMSDLLYKVVLKDRARSNYSGLIRVRKVAQRTDAYQANRNLLLSDTAKADSVPKLEILADDVRCTHGATVGPVDEEQSFYLTSRGIDPAEAEELVVEGFFEPIFERVKLDPVWHERLQSWVREKLASNT